MESVLGKANDEDKSPEGGTGKWHLLNNKEASQHGGFRGRKGRQQIMCSFEVTCRLSKMVLP